MRKLYTTNTNNIIIVEMTKTEFDALQALALVGEGCPFDQTEMYVGPCPDGDLSPLLTAIKTFTTCAGHINQLRALLDDASDLIFNREDRVSGD